MFDSIFNFFKEILIQDYIIFWISVWFFAWFYFIWIEKIYKSYLGVIFWLFIFSIINLSLWTLNDKNIVWNSLREFFYIHRQWLWFYSIIFIPLLAILLPLNKNISFRVSKKIYLNYFVIFLFWIFFFSFLLTIFLSIINNKFLFSMDNIIIIEVRNSYLIKSMYEYFWPSKIFNFLTKYDYIINLIIILFIFYKMTIWWIVDFLMAKLLKVLIHFFEEKNTDEHWVDHWHSDDHHSGHWHDNHWHWDEHDWHWHEDHWNSDDHHAGHWHDNHWHH